MPPDSTTDNRERILYLLKTKGRQTTAALARRLDLTPMGVRQHLAKLRDAGWVDATDERRPVGRPVQVWTLTEAGNGRFPQSYGELTVGLLDGIRETFGDDGLARLVRRRTREQLARYRERLPAAAPLSRRVAALARLRSDEGYMAEWRKDGRGGFLLIENHCPICVAARACQGLCDGELELFRESLGPDASVERTEHLLAESRRCVFRVLPASVHA